METLRWQYPCPKTSRAHSASWWETPSVGSHCFTGYRTRRQPSPRNVRLSSFMSPLRTAPSFLLYMLLNDDNRWESHGPPRRIAYIKRLNSALVPGCLQIQTNRTRIDSPILYSTVAPSIQNPISTPPFRGILRCQFFIQSPALSCLRRLGPYTSFRQLWRALRPELIAFSIDGFQRFRSIPSDPIPSIPYHHGSQRDLSHSFSCCG
ncbi:uncharacterized protein BDCG_16064 [Blastomyces dermatitidis ER-3]|uniref:Uncharacterized protein n=1 Tax=Ajellomyces dermatitidis (strain ER-3 / ATCC MYA-2586) TaxID=559297 RepID=A0ABX2VPY2_AJEDR|nr:uncharacterized protein BDCG_16064 [Blastomyces dermatitidis ER-3]OAS99322.1 hypothetical protein BDCG_16064 [Blastomyces dermatitidis ER-3]